MSATGLIHHDNNIVDYCNIENHLNATYIVLEREYCECTQEICDA